MNILSTSLSSAPRLASRLLPFAALAVLALVPQTVHAQVAGLNFSFAPATQTVGIGGSADYTGVFTNTTTTNYFVTVGDYSANGFGGSPLVTGSFSFDPFTPYEVFAGQTQTLMGAETLSADPTLGAGTYTGTVRFFGQTEADFRAGTGMDIPLSNAPLTLVVASGAPAPVPEASTLVSLSLLLLLSGAGVWRARRGAAPA